MPRFDGRGPFGYGPMTGRGMGPCGCFGRRFFSRKDEEEILKEEAENLKQELEAVQERLTEIKDKK
jgi:hypothetical protein